MVTSDGLKKDPSVIKKPGKAKFCSLRYTAAVHSPWVVVDKRDGKKGREDTKTNSG